MFPASRKVQRLAEAELLRARTEVRILMARAIVFLVAAVIAIVGLAMLAVAAALALSDVYGPVGGAAMAGGLILAVALVVAGLAALFSGRTARRLSTDAVRAARADLADDMARVSTLLGGTGHGKPGALAVAGLLAGIAVGLSPRLRRFLLG